VLTAFQWMATSFGTDAGRNCVAYTGIEQQSSGERADFRIASG